MTGPESLSRTDLTTVGIGVIVGLVVLGFLISLVVTAIVARIVIAVVVVAAAALVWQQRTSIQDDLTTRACNLNSTFFGLHVDVPRDVTRYCRRHG